MQVMRKMLYHTPIFDWFRNMKNTAKLVVLKKLSVGKYGLCSKFCENRSYYDRYNKDEMR